MTIKVLLLRFFLIYTGLMVLVGVILSLLQINGSSGVNIGVLIGAITWVCTSFAKKNGRYFSKKEKAAVVFGMLAIDLLIQFLQSLIALTQTPGPTNFAAIFFALTVVGVLDLLAIYLFVSIEKRFLVKQGIIKG